MASTLQNAAKGDFSFFWLPAEVRCLIYRQLLDAQEDGAVNIKKTDPFYKITPIFPSILRTCRMIYMEAIRILYKVNKFLFNSERRGPYTHVKFLSGGIRTTSLLHNVQLIVSNHELLSETSPRRHYTYQLVRELSGSGEPRGSFSIAFQKCWKTGSGNATIAVDVTNILVQSIRALSAFKEVVVVALPYDDRGFPAKMVWSKAFRRELESGLGPNYSLQETRLEFRPRNKPRNWIQETTSPLMRLPAVVRIRIIGHILESRTFVYPSQPNYGMNQGAYGTDWDTVATIARCNPGRCLEFLFTCRKLWEEGWQYILLHRHIIFNFDFDLGSESTNHDSTMEQNSSWLPNTILVLRNLDNSTEIWNTFSYLENLLRGLSKPPESPFVERAIPERRHLIIEIGINHRRWIGYPPVQRIPLTGKNYIAYRDPQHPNIHYTELNGVPYLNDKNAHDIEIGRFLKQMTEWRRVDIVLLPETQKSYSWRQQVTDYLEDTLGPQLSSNRGHLTFRPRYFRDIHAEVSREVAYEFMRGRKHFSDDVWDDLRESVSHTYHGADGAGDDNSSDNHDVSYPSGAHETEQVVDHQYRSGVVDVSDELRENFDAIDELEMKEGPRLSALETSAARHGLGSEDEQLGTENEESV